MPTRAAGRRRTAACPRGAKGGQKRPLRTGAPKQAVVLAKKQAEMSPREIARSEGMSRKTVAKILSQEEFQQLLQGRTRLIELIPKSVCVYEKVLSRRGGKDQVLVARQVRPGSRRPSPAGPSPLKLPARPLRPAKRSERL